jgi:hypothetical protein
MFKRWPYSVDAGGIHQKQKIIITVMRMQEHSVPIDPWPANPHPIMVVLENHCSISLFKMSGLMNFIYFSE